MAEPLSILDNMPQMASEHRAWRAVCHELKALGINIDEADGLHRAVTLWGEELAQLRTQAPEHLEAALTSRREEYDPRVIIGEDDG